MSKARDYRRCPAHRLRVIAEFEGIALCYACVVCRFYAEMESKPLAAMLGRSPKTIAQVARKYGVYKSAAFIATHKCGRFDRGDQPWNKGKKLPNWTRGRMAETQFKKGSRTGAAALNWRPVGTIREDPEGYMRIKIREWKSGDRFGFGNPEIWPFLHRHNWVKEKGPIPAGHVVVLRDGDKKNCAVGNLELITRSALMARNTIHNLPGPLKNLIQLNGILKRKIRRFDEKHNDGLTQPPVRNAGSTQRQGRAYGD